MARDSKNGRFSASDITGQRHGCVTAIQPTEKRSIDGSIIWVMKCDCGLTFERPSGKFRATFTCGCGSVDNEGQFVGTDWRGRTFHECVVVAPTDKRYWGYIVWTLRCFMCDEEFERPTYGFKSGRVRHGCPKWWARYGKGRKPGKKPLPEFRSHARSIWGSIKKGADVRDIHFALTVADVATIVKQDCVYCGSPPKKRHVGRRLHGSESCSANGIDRFDNQIGYTVDNCVPCCLTCNRGKGTKTPEEFADWITRVHAHFASHALGRRLNRPEDALRPHPPEYSV